MYNVHPNMPLPNLCLSSKSPTKCGEDPPAAESEPHDHRNLVQLESPRCRIQTCYHQWPELPAMLNLPPSAESAPHNPTTRSTLPLPIKSVLSGVAQPETVGKSCWRKWQKWIITQ